MDQTWAGVSARAVGGRLRDVRRRLGLTLHGVEQATRHEQEDERHDAGETPEGLLPRDRIGELGHAAAEDEATNGRPTSLMMLMGACAT